MPKIEQSRIDVRIEEAAKVAPVPEAVTNLVSKQLQGVMGERALKGAETTRLANDLIAASRKRATEEPAA